MSQPTSTELLDHAIWTELGSRNDAEAEVFALRLFAKVRAYVATPERFL
jgi:hypothetical protein